MNHRRGIEKYKIILQKLGKKVNSATCLPAILGEGYIPFDYGAEGWRWQDEFSGEL
ncbi:MAG: hypothetical protein ABIK15_03670 [Pseudomonadota bacterium]